HPPTNGCIVAVGARRRYTESKRKPRRAGAFQGEVMRTSRDQGALDAPILSQSRKAQNCYLAMADAPRPVAGYDGPGLVICTEQGGHAHLLVSPQSTSCHQPVHEPTQP